MATQGWPLLLASVFPQQGHTQAETRDIFKRFCTISGGASVRLLIRKAISAIRREDFGSHSICARFVLGLTHGMGDG